MRVGVMDGILGKPSDPESVALAARLGFAGLQVTLGGIDEARIAAFRREAQAQQVQLVATYLDVLHKNCLKSDAAARDDVRRGIAQTHALGACVCMLVFFGKCALKGQPELEAVAAALSPLAEEAHQANVILGFENLLTAEENLWVLRQVNSPALKIYYDIGNATNMVGVDPGAELRQFGADNLCQVHVKDQGYLGEGKVDVKGALRVLKEIGYRGYLVLETSSPSGDRLADLERNARYLKKLLQEV